MSAAQITTASIPRMPRGVRMRFDEARDQWILLGPERVLKLDDIAREILNRCDGEADLRAIVDDLAQAFDAEPSIIEADVMSFIGDLKTRGFLDVE